MGILYSKAQTSCYTKAQLVIFSLLPIDGPLLPRTQEVMSLASLSQHRAAIHFRNGGIHGKMKHENVRMSK